MYRWDAENYKKSSREQQKWARELIAKLNLRGSKGFWIWDVEMGRSQRKLR